MNAFELGKSAYIMEKVRTDNPFQENTENWAAWDHGWLDAYYTVQHLSPY